MGNLPNNDCEVNQHSMFKYLKNKCGRIHYLKCFKILTILLTISPFILDFILRNFLNLINYTNLGIFQLVKSFWHWVINLFVPDINPSYTNDLFVEVCDLYIKIIATSIPIVSALAYFIYREQKNISLRNQHSKYLLPYFVFSISSITLSLSLKIISSYSINEKFSPFFINHPIKIIVWMIVCVYALYYLFKVVFSSLLGIDFRYQFKKSNTDIVHYIERAYNTKDSNNIENIYKSLHENFESIFQMIDYASRNNLSKLFKEEHDNLSLLLHKLMEGTPNESKEQNDNSLIYSKKLLSNNNDYFSFLYHVLVMNTVNSLLKFHNENKLPDSDFSDNLKALEPNKVSELNPIYLEGIENLAIRSINNEFPFEKTLSFLEKFSGRGSTKNNILTGVIIIYQSILKVAVEKNDVRKLTAITYSLQRLIEPNKNENAKSTKIQRYIRKSIQFQNEKEILTSLTLYILFQAVLKSIELGSYSSTGLLIKRITTDFSGEEINDTFRLFSKSKGKLKEAYNKCHWTENFSDIITDYSFNNTASFNYCIQKLVLLLIAQEHFIIEEKLEFTEFYNSEHKFISTDCLELPYIEYIMDKIIKVGDAYGLLFVNQNDFLMKLIQDIKTANK